MLNTANALLQVTWLPDDPITDLEDDLPFKGSLRNMEHIAATSSAIQNMLLTATGLNIPNYWSSGGVLKTNELSKVLEISQNEILLGAIFLFPEDVSKAKVVPGGLRDKKGERSQWTRYVSL